MRPLPRDQFELAARTWAAEDGIRRRTRALAAIGGAYGFDGFHLEAVENALRNGDGDAVVERVQAFVRALLEVLPEEHALRRTLPITLRRLQ
jgi:hypothetical protein